MNISQTILTTILGLTLCQSTLVTAQSSPFVNSFQGTWQFIKTDTQGNQWYLDRSAIETVHNLDGHNHHAGYVKVISPNGQVTQLALGIDCKTGTLQRFSSSGVQISSIGHIAEGRTLAKVICQNLFESMND